MWEHSIGHTRTTADWAKELNVSLHALDLYLSSDVVDLHVDSYIWTRCFGYKLEKRHGPGVLHARFCRQVDIPRIREARISGATWVITTNPWRTKKGRAKVIARNYERLKAILGTQDKEVRIVRTHSEYLDATKHGLHAAFLGIQGANAVEDPGCWDSLVDQRFLRITLMHLTNSGLGQTSTPLRWGKDRGLTRTGHDLIKHMNSRRVLVDLAHASKRTFFDALSANDPSIPIIVTHTGIDAICPHWRNLTNDQLRAVADTGGVVGVFYHSPYLQKSLRRCNVRVVATHIAHAVRVLGAAHVAIGSDWDGNIITPSDMPTCLELPRLVQALLDERLSDDEIHWVLGASFLRMLKSTRP